MTLGEKIKNARKQCGLSQEQLAEKMAVSRSAVAKWESGKGLPDIENLKALARFLNVSVDHLLDDGQEVEVLLTREAYDLAAYGNGIRKKKKDRVIREKYPDAEIHTLLGKIKLTKSEKVIDNLLGFFTDAPFGTPDLLNSFKNLDKEFYLVESNGNQLLVTVTDDFIETRQLSRKVEADRFEIGSWQFTKCKYQVK